MATVGWGWSLFLLLAPLYALCEHLNCLGGPGLWCTRDMNSCPISPHHPSTQFVWFALRMSESVSRPHVRVLLASPQSLPVALDTSRVTLELSVIPGPRTHRLLAQRLLLDSSEELHRPLSPPQPPPGLLDASSYFWLEFVESRSMWHENQVVWGVGAS